MTDITYKQSDVGVLAISDILTIYLRRSNLVLHLLAGLFIIYK